MLAVIILTHNEALHIKRAIESVAGLAREIFVVDSFSNDGTQDIAREAGATVLERKWTNYSTQFEWALQNAPITAPWILRLDADEVIEGDLANEIAEILPRLGIDTVGININRKHVFMGRWIKHGGRSPLMLLRIWRNGCGRIEDRWMDEHIIVDGGRTITLRGGFSDRNLKDLTFFTAKHNSYATREAIDILIDKYSLLGDGEVSSENISTRQAAFRRFVKKNVYNKCPFWLTTPMYFIVRYVFQLGFLDGLPGLIYHFLQGFWYRFLVGAKVYEFNRALRSLSSSDERLKMLSALTGHDLMAQRGSGLKLSNRDKSREILPTARGSE